MKAATRDRITLAGAWMCLFAAVCLYAPLGAAAWSTYAMACCTGDYCPITAHQHRQKAPASHSGTDCEHDTGNAMNCSMSCCDSSEKPVVTAVTFVLPHGATAFAPASMVPTTPSAHGVAVPSSVEPLSPPPRFAATA